MEGTREYRVDPSQAAWQSPDNASGPYSTNSEFLIATADMANVDLYDLGLPAWRVNELLRKLDQAEQQDPQ